MSRFRFPGWFGDSVVELPDPPTYRWSKGQQRCPVCEGRGIVPHGFYAHPAGQSFTSNSTAPERCRRCGGVGTIAA